MPVLNDRRDLAAAVGTVLAQDYPGDVEVVLALGPSTDGTDAVASRLCQQDRRVRAVANPSGCTASGLNAAIAATRYPVVARLDAHSEVAENYLATAVRLLCDTHADNVGGMLA